MASLYREQDRSRTGYRLRFRDHLQKQRSIWLGKISKRSAETVQRHVAELVRAKKANVKPETDSVKWSESLDGRLRERLAEIGLVPPKRTFSGGDHQMRLGAFLDTYIKERTDAKPSTITNYKHARHWLVEFFGLDKPLREITQADADRWHRHLGEGDKLAISTIEKIMKRAKTMFEHAVRDPPRSRPSPQQVSTFHCRKPLLLNNLRKSPSRTVIAKPNETKSNGTNPCLTHHEC